MLPAIACNRILIWWFRPVVIIHVQYIEHWNVMVICAEHSEKFYLCAIIWTGDYIASRKFDVSGRKLVQLERLHSAGPYFGNHLFKSIRSARLFYILFLEVKYSIHFYLERDSHLHLYVNVIIHKGLFHWIKNVNNFMFVLLIFMEDFVTALGRSTWHSIVVG